MNMIDIQDNQRLVSYGSIGCHQWEDDNIIIDDNNRLNDDENTPVTKAQRWMKFRTNRQFLFILFSTALMILAFIFSDRLDYGMEFLKVLTFDLSKEPDALMGIAPTNKNDGTNEESMESNGVILPHEQVALLRDHLSVPPPFSTLDPVSDLKIYPYKRSSFSTPGTVFGDKLQKGQSETGIPLPTNKWYENMVLISDSQLAPNDDNRVYTVPYVVSANGPVPGIKLSSTRLLGMEKVVQVTFVDHHGLTLGAAESFSTSSNDSFGNTVNRRYMVFDDHVDESANDNTNFDNGNPVKNHSPLTPLGFTVEWKPAAEDSSSPFNFMSSSIVRGMPYGTMHYQYDSSKEAFDPILPTIVSEIPLYSPPLADSEVQLSCSKDKSILSEEQLVRKSISITFLESDITWLVFYSHPVYVRCYDIPAEITSTPFVIQVTRLARSPEEDEDNNIVLTSRVALMNNCTLGTNPSHCTNGLPSNMTSYNNLLHKHADVYPGRNTKIDYTFFSDEVKGGGTYVYLQYDWDAYHVRNGKLTTENGDKAGLLMYSLPHHREIMYSQSMSPNSFQFNEGITYCTPSLNGDACIVDGVAWVLKETLISEPSFFAPRPPLPSAIKKLSNAIKKDIKFRVPSYFARGAGDTYFSGKILAKLSRILLITHELKEVCSKSEKYGKDYIDACNRVKLPTLDEFNAALDHLRSATEVWINGTAETPFVYDDKWGGLCSCGCNFNDDTQSCDNEYPNCPAFSDPGLDFGHAFYNDHHFHQGYHIYAAATVAHFDHNWGEQYFENVLLLIRDIANPSVLDEYFPVYRMKDWYLGNSWAGGIARAYPNGRNQESSSESIAAYEAISMFGKVMVQIFEGRHDIKSKGQAAVSRHVRDVGRLLTATELRSADRYWHVRQSGEKSGIYPTQYKPLVVGIMWNMMAQFQTWFGNAPHLAYGIQLLPLTPVSEKRDALDWIKELYPSFAESCFNAPDCKEQGWGILQHAILAELGYPKLAIEYAESLPSSAFLSAGGNGHSLTNTIWYYATRPVIKPVDVPDILPPSPTASTNLPSNKTTTIDCGCPETCTKEVLNYSAGGYTCGVRIQWLIKNEGKSPHNACSKVAGVEFTDTCAGCDPNRCTAPKVSPKEENSSCPACTQEQCRDGILNKCPVLDAPYLCTDGANKGGCSMVPWTLNTSGGSNCNKCCQLTYECQ